MEQAPRPRPLVAGPLARPPLIPRTLRQLGRARPLAVAPPLLPRVIAENAPPVDLAAALDRRAAGGSELILARRHRPSGAASTRGTQPAGAEPNGLNDQEWFTRMAGYLRAKSGDPAAPPKPAAPRPTRKAESDAEWYERMRVALQTKRDRIQAEREAAEKRLKADVKAATPEPEPDPDPEATERAREAARQAAFRRAALGSVALARHARVHDSAITSEPSAGSETALLGEASPQDVTGVNESVIPSRSEESPIPVDRPASADLAQRFLAAARNDIVLERHVIPSRGEESLGQVRQDQTFPAAARNDASAADDTLDLAPPGPGAATSSPAEARDLTIGGEAREYQSADGAPVTSDDRSRLDAIGARAVAICERELGVLLSVATRRMIDLVEIDLDLDLTRMSDDEAAETWGRELARAVRGRLRRAE